VTRGTALAIQLTLAACVLILTPGAQTSSTNQGGQRGTLWVVNKTLNNVTAFDGATGAVIATVPVGKNPNSVVVAPVSHKAYVTNEDSNDVTVISTTTHTVVATIPVPSRPHHIRTSLDGSRVYVAEYGANKVAVIDTASDKVVGELVAAEAANAKTHSTWLTRDGKLLLAANEAASSVSIVDLGTGKIVGAVALGLPPSEVLVTANGTTAYVSIRNGAIKVVDVAARAVTGEVTLPAAADTLQLTPDGKQLMVALRGLPAQLSVVDTKTLKIVQTVDLAGGGTIAGHNWLSANGRYSFVSYEGGASPGVAVVDHRSGTVVQTLAYPGGGRPHGVYYDDPAATEGPAVFLAPGKTRVARGRATIAVTCSGDAVGFCHGRLSLAGGSTAFAIEPTRSARVQVRPSATILKRLTKSARLSLVAKAVVSDELGNLRVTVRKVTLLAPASRR
jgi:YVTN family beta-propeller protein